MGFQDENDCDTILHALLDRGGSRSTNHRPYLGILVHRQHEGAMAQLDLIYN